MVGRRRGAPEIIIGELEHGASVFLSRVHGAAIACDIYSGLLRGQFGGCAVFISGANIKDFMAQQAHGASIDIGREHRACQISKVFDAVNIGQGRGDKNSGHRLGSNALARARKGCL